MSKKMTMSDLQKHIISEVKKLHRIEVLKEEKSKIEKQIQLLGESSYNSENDKGQLVSDVIEILKQSDEGNNVIKNLGLDGIKQYSDNLYGDGKAYYITPKLQAMIMKKNYGSSDYETSKQKLERFRDYEYYLDGEKVYPEINYYNNFLGAKINDRYYKIDKIEGEEGKYSLRIPRSNPN